MIDRTHDLPLTRQAALLRLSRSSLYYEPQPVPEAELAGRGSEEAVFGLQMPREAAGP